MDEVIINIEESGKTTGLHFDKFPLNFLGDMDISRASEIFFNNQKQNWEVILPGDKHAIDAATEFSSYEEARKFEVDWLQTCMKEDVHPKSLAGASIASELHLFA